MPTIRKGFTLNNIDLKNISTNYNVIYLSADQEFVLNDKFEMMYKIVDISDDRIYVRILTNEDRKLGEEKGYF